MGGGGVMLAFGMTCALLERVGSGKGQVVDTAMVEGAALLATSIYAQKAMGSWRSDRGANLLDSGAHFYEVYETKDGGTWRLVRSSRSSTICCFGVCRSIPPPFRRRWIVPAGLP
jgi:crotonobetainyl-CoA:carnitine CoA-transferase CaiB-like acyl-CoA transferase